MAFEVTAFNPTVKGAELAAEIVDEIVTGAPPHTVYTLRIRRGHRSWVVRVRFSQFETLRNAMQADVGAGAAIPPLPAKVPRLLMRALCLDERRSGLEDFLRACCAEPALAAHAAFRSFICDAGWALSPGDAPPEAPICMGDAHVRERLAAVSAAATLAVRDARQMKSDLASARASLSECAVSVQALSAEAAEARATTAVAQRALCEAAAKAKAACALLLAERDRLLAQADEVRGAVRVYARIRPMTEVEARAASAHGQGAARRACALAGATAAGFARSVHVWSPSHADALAGVTNAPLSLSASLEFDRAFGPECSDDDDLFLEIVPLALSALAGDRATVLAYGATGSGKTHTMRALSGRLLGELLGRAGDDAGDLEVWISAAELYNETARDLLPKGVAGTNLLPSAAPPSAPLELHHADGLWRLEGLARWGPIRCAADGEALVDLAHARRATADNVVHAGSSRSHLVLTVSIHRESRVFGQLSLVDLAGSERHVRTRTAGVRREEGVEINKSLSALGDVLSALAAGARHVPYRNSKLTQLLQPGMRRGCRVAMVANASPAAIDAHHTAAALAFASSARAARLGPAVGGFATAPRSPAASNTPEGARGSTRELARAQRERGEAARALVEATREVAMLRAEKSRLRSDPLATAPLGAAAQPCALPSVTPSHRGGKTALEASGTVRTVSLPRRRARLQTVSVAESNSLSS